MNTSQLHNTTHKINTSSKAKIIVKEAMNALGIQKNMQTDPLTMQSILNELNLHDFKTTFTPIKKFLNEVVKKPMSLKPMLNSIEHGLISKHPAIIEFLELALEKNWLKKGECVKKSLQITFILETITAAMCNNHAFLIETENHYRSKELELGLDKKNIYKTVKNSWGKFHDLFKVAKIMALDPIMIYFRLQRGLGDSLISIPELKKLHKENKINYFEYKLLYKLCDKCSDPANKLVRINIFEAGITEYKRGFKMNAISAYVLAEDLKQNPPYAIFKKRSVIPDKDPNPFYGEITKKKDKFINIDADQDWVSLYITWNLAFILGNLNNLDLLFPKLLMPSIINAKSNNFLGVRVVSLWLSINHFLFRDSEGKKLFGPKNKKEMAQAWGEINKKYAFDLAKNKMATPKQKILDEYRSFFTHPIYKMFLLVSGFFKRTCRF